MEERTYEQVCDITRQFLALAPTVLRWEGRLWLRSIKLVIDGNRDFPAVGFSYYSGNRDERILVCVALNVGADLYEVRVAVQGRGTAYGGQILFEGKGVHVEQLAEVQRWIAGQPLSTPASARGAA